MSNKAWCADRSKGKTIYRYGDFNKGGVTNVTATVEHQDDGTWRWKLLDSGKEGTAPTALDAIHNARDAMKR